MTRQAFIITDHARRARAIEAVYRAPVGFRVTIAEPTRSQIQNDKMWAMIADIRRHEAAKGRVMTDDEWKVALMAACGHEVRFIENLDRTGFIPYGQSSKALSVRRMCNLIEFMTAWGIENGVQFHDDFMAGRDAA